MTAPTNGCGGLCQCGCGERTPLARDTDSTRGYTRGEPVRFVAGHQNRGRRFGPLSPEHRAKIAAAHLTNPRERVCEQCGAEYRRDKPSQRFCSQTCRLVSLNANHERPTGEANPGWKGDDAGYAAKHSWINRHHERTGRCEACGTEDRKTDWSNIDHTYRRVRADWRELCRSCHRKHDNQRKRATA